MIADLGGFVEQNGETANEIEKNRLGNFNDRDIGRRARRRRARLVIEQTHPAEMIAGFQHVENDLTIGSALDDFDGT